MDGRATGELGKCDTTKAAVLRNDQDGGAMAALTRPRGHCSSYGNPHARIREAVQQMKLDNQPDTKEHTGADRWEGSGLRCDAEDGRSGGMSAWSHARHVRANAVRR